MAMRNLIPTAALALYALIFGGAHSVTAAEAPTPAQALTLTPIQPLVEFTTPPQLLHLGLDAIASTHTNRWQ